MFARIVEFIPKLEKKEEFVKVIRNEVLPILKKQTGFMELLPFFPEIKNEKVIAVTLWTEKANAHSGFASGAKGARAWSTTSPCLAACAAR